MLSPAAVSAVWGKSVQDDAGACVAWLPVLQHLDDTEGIAALLVDEWVSPQVRSHIAAELPDGEHGVRVLARWLAAVHDVGKCSPAFVVQVRDLVDYLHGFGVSVPVELAGDPERRKVNHTLVGHSAVRAWLTAELGFAADGLADQLASVVGSHHGIAPDHGGLRAVRRRPDLAGTGEWTDLRAQVLDRATRRVGGLAAYRDVSLSRTSQVLLTAIVVIADWVASNDDLFPLRPKPSDGDPATAPNDSATGRRVRDAWRRLALPAGWSAEPIGDDVDAVCRSRFGHPARPVQVAAVRAARTGPGLLVIEAPTGSGKTAAALLAAEVLAHRTGANGVFVAVPAQATTDAAFDRVRAWLERVPGARPDLVHGTPHADDEFRGIAADWPTRGPASHDYPSIAHTWLRGRKRAAFASFVVGTIDQVLCTALKSRYLVLRHLAFAGKVVILDEVHAHDVDTSPYLHRALHWLGAYGVPVVLLSAALPDERRAELARAYGSATPVAVPPPDTTADVALDRLPDDLAALVAYLRTHLRDGGCAAVVRNTVPRVREAAVRLIEEFGADAVTVTHSQFLACERSELDRRLVARFGRSGDRPPLHIVVGSPVLESLDVDFDLLVTDLAPIDLVLHRIGRLHRHRRTRPAPLSAARCAVVGPLAGQGVYDEHHLTRASALLGDVLRLPRDVAPLVRAAYAAEPPSTVEPSLLEPDAPGSLVGWSRTVGDVTEDTVEGVARVRNGVEALEVLVLQEDGAGGRTTPTWLPGGGHPIPDAEELPWPLSRTVATCSLRLPSELNHPDVLADLATTNGGGVEHTPALAKSLVLVLDQHGQATVAGHRLTYDPRLGLRLEAGAC